MEVYKIRNQFKIWKQSNYSFSPGLKWISKYRLKYNQRIRKEREAGIYTVRQKEEELRSTSWLRNDDWNGYYKRLRSAITENEYDIKSLLNLIKKSDELLKIPWQISYFQDIERRKIMGGRSPYGELGHIVSSGWLAGLLTNGPKKKWEIIIKAINNIAAMNIPLDYLKLELELQKLIKLGFTMKVWGRFLCLIRPDLYCTVSSNYVRKNLAESLKAPQSFFNTAEGYIKLIKMLHSSPWSNTGIPKNKHEIIYWKYRTALMDVIFYR